MKSMLIIALVLYVNFSSAQNYYVIKVEGSVFCNQKELKTGDKLVIDSQIRFSSGHDKLYLLSPEKGYFILSPETPQMQNSKSWVTTLRNVIIPEIKFYNTASRNLTDTLRFDDIYDLMGFFRDKVTLIGETKFSINPLKIPLDKSNFLEISSLTGNLNSIELNYTPGMDFITLKAVGPESQRDNRFQLNYQQQGKKTEIGTFILYARNKEDISKELALFFTTPGIKDPVAVYYEQILPFVKEAYGNTDLQTIRAILRDDLHIPL